MSQAAVITRDAAGEAALLARVQSLLARARGREVAIAALRCEPSPFASRVPAEVVCVTLSGGEEVSLFLKSSGGEEADHPDKQVRDREIRIYLELLCEDHLPVPRCYGADWNPALARRELYLEYVPDWDLRYQELDYWFIAAERLADLHVHFAATPARLAAPFLTRFDARYFQDWAARALDSVHEVAPEVRPRYAEIVARYGAPAEILAAQPVTLVHNDLAAKNVLVDRSAAPARVCFIDWEMAGAGCGLLDLVHLKYGLDPESDRRMREAYLRKTRPLGLVPASDAELDRLLAACEIHKAALRLWRNRVWRLPLERVTEWVSETEAYLRLVESRSGEQ